MAWGASQIVYAKVRKQKVPSDGDAEGGPERGDSHRLECDTADGADQALETLLRLESEQLLDLIHGAVANWPAGAKKPKTRQLKPTRGKVLVGKRLLGLIFAVPLLGLALGGRMGALTASMTDMGAPLTAIVLVVIVGGSSPDTMALIVLSTAVGVLVGGVEACRSRHDPRTEPR